MYGVLMSQVEPDSQLSLYELYKLTGNAPKLTTTVHRGMDYFAEIHGRVANSAVSDGREFSDSNRHCMAALVCSALAGTSMEMYGNKRAYSEYLPVADMLLCAAFEAAFLLINHSDAIKKKCWALRNNHACVASSMPRNQELLLASYIRVAAAFGSPALRMSICEVLKRFKFVNVDDWVSLPKRFDIRALFKDKGAILQYFDDSFKANQYRTRVESIQGVPVYLIEDYLIGRVGYKSLCLLDQWKGPLPLKWRSLITEPVVMKALEDVVHYGLGYVAEERIKELKPYVVCDSGLSSLLPNKGIFQI